MEKTELRQYIAIGLKWWWLIVLLTLVAAATGYAVSQREVPVYQATTTLMVGQSIQSVDLDRADILTSQILAQTYADMARRQPVLQEVVETLGLKNSWQSLKNRVRTQLVRDTQLLQITVEAGSPTEAQVTADEVARHLIRLSPTALQNQKKEEDLRFVHQRLESLQAKIEAGVQRLEMLEVTMAGALSAEQVQELQAEINTLEQLIADWENNYTQLLIFVESDKSPNTLTIVEPAQADPNPIRPQIRQDTLLAAVVGLLLALGLIFLQEYLDDTLKTKSDLSQTLGLPPLGTISRIKGKDYPDKLIAIHDLFTPVGEAYRIIRSNIQFASVDRPVKSIMITSPSPNEGKSITVANLGVVMAQAELKTIIVDADLRRPVQHQIFQVSTPGGLTDLLLSPKPEPESYLRKTGIDNLQVITSGALPPNPSELLGSRRMEQLLSSLAGLADVVIYDSPPVLLVADAAVLSNKVDGVVLVTLAGATRLGTAGQAMINLQQAGAYILGGVLNQVKGKRVGDYHYKGYYHATYQSTPKSQPIATTPRRRWRWLPFFK